jgi:hypothetical protein
MGEKEIKQFIGTRVKKGKRYEMVFREVENPEPLYWIDENGERWDVVRTIPCPNKSENALRKKRTKSSIKSLESSYKLDLTISLDEYLPEPCFEHSIFRRSNPIKTHSDDASINEIDLVMFNCIRPIYEIEPTVALTPVKRNLLKGISSKEKHEDFPFYEKHHTKLCEYLEKNLNNEITRLVKRLHAELRALDERGPEREGSIFEILKEEEETLRQRLKVARGRIPIKESEDFEDERKEFICKCLTALNEIARKKKKLNKSQLAKNLYFDENPPQTLRRKFKYYNLTFEEIMNQFSEQKSP